MVVLCWSVFPSLSARFGQFFASSLLLSHQFLLLGAPFLRIKELEGRFGLLHSAEFPTVSGDGVKDVLFMVS